MKSFFKFYNPTLNGVLQNLAHKGNKKSRQVPSKRGQAAGTVCSPYMFVLRALPFPLPWFRHLCAGGLLRTRQICQFVFPSYTTHPSHLTTFVPLDRKCNDETRHWQDIFLEWLDSPQWARASSLSRLHDHNFTFMLPWTVIDFFLNNQPDALII